MSTDPDASAETNPSASTTQIMGMPPPPRAAELVSDDQGKRLYWDRSHYESPAAQMKALRKSSTLYVGNLSFSTRMRHIRANFESIGPVKTVHMGLDRLKKTPCGFCFVVYQQQADALAAVALLSGTKLDGNVIRVELDAGFQPGRQYGRGASGGQVRDDRRKRMENKRERDEESVERSTEDLLSAPLSSDRPRRDSAENDSKPDGQDQGGYYGPSGDRGDDDVDMEREAKRQRL